MKAKFACIKILEKNCDGTQNRERRPIGCWSQYRFRCKRRIKLNFLTTLNTKNVLTFTPMQLCLLMLPLKKVRKVNLLLWYLSNNMHCWPCFRLFYCFPFNSLQYLVAKRSCTFFTVGGCDVMTREPKHLFFSPSSNNASKTTKTLSRGKVKLYGKV